jgi:hypothetical protein
VVLVDAGMSFAPLRSGEKLIVGWCGVGEPTSLTPDELRDAFIHLSVPIIRTCTTPSSASPVCATLYHDLQLVPFIERGEAEMHVGPPAVGVEVELRGDGVEVLDEGGDPRGTVSSTGNNNVALVLTCSGCVKMFVRGPAVLSGSSNK